MNNDISILRRPQVEAKTGLSRSSIYAQMKKGHFPKPIKLGPRSVGWVDSSINAWIQAKIDDPKRADIRHLEGD